MKRIYLFLPQEYLEIGNALASQIDTDTGGAETFGNVKLSHNGEEPPFFYGASTMISDEGLEQVKKAMKQIPNAHILEEGQIIDDEIVILDFDSALNFLNLKRIKKEDFLK